MKRSEAQRAAYAANAPRTVQHNLATYVEQSLLNTELFYAKLGIVLAYRFSFLGQDGILYHAGVVTREAAGVGVTLGLVWSWKASELRRV